jgi:hypothetical protein
MWASKAVYLSPFLPGLEALSGAVRDVRSKALQKLTSANRCFRPNAFMWHMTLGIMFQLPLG